MDTELRENEERLAEDAHSWIKYNESVLIERFASLREHETDSVLVSLFMAGSPGAGKTEVSKRLMRRFAKKPVRIDADEIRMMCPMYEGRNAHIFQRAANKGVNMLYDHALRHGLNLILDGTFAYGNAEENIRRSLAKERSVEIFFVYQDPVVAWDFTQKREAIEGRRVTKDVFINGWIRSRENVRKIKKKFGNGVDLQLLIKDLESGTEDLKSDVSDIDQHLKTVYTREDLERLL